VGPARRRPACARALCRLRALLLNRWLLAAAGVQPPRTLEAIAAGHVPRALEMLRARAPGRALAELQARRAGRVVGLRGRRIDPPALPATRRLLA
jgi:hypothetical protein